MEIQHQQQTEEEDSSTRESDPTRQHVVVNEEPTSSCRARSRPKLMTTKSYPPYNHCIGGLGEDGGQDCQLDSEPSDAFQPYARHTKEENPEDIKGTERKEDIRLIARCSGNEVKPRWRSRRREEVGVDTSEEKDEEAEELPGMMEGNTTHRWFSPHPILSKLLQASSSSSSCSSVNLSSAESDDVFSEGEEAASKRKTFRKCRSWKTFQTLMHWSVRQQRSWVQLAGHQGSFQPSKGGEVLKPYSEVEAKCLESLMKDPLSPFVPQYRGTATRGEHCYIRLEDLLSDLGRPLIMDCKMGVRTYQEEEVLKAHSKATLRSDLYQKMVKLDPSAPSAEEHAQRAVTKWRYLQWRDTTTSTTTLGLRIEGIMMEDGSIQRDFRRVQTLSQLTETLLNFTGSQPETLKAYRSRLLTLNKALKSSPFFRTHEVIGSSLLFVHDCDKANVWMIDFGKTTPLPESRELQHNVSWVEGSKEDGYLIGLTSLISSLTQALSTASCRQRDSCRAEKPVT